MLPIRDTIRSTSFPVVTWLLIGVNAVAFLYEISLPTVDLNELILMYGLVPARLQLTQPLAMLEYPYLLLSLVTHMFLHGGWLHFLSNMWILFIFGDNVEDRMGSARFFLFYIISGLFGALVQAFIYPTSQVPAIGASGAIAGVLGAYWALFPRAKVISLIPLIFVPWFVEIPAVFYLGFWLVTQVYFGITSLPNSGMLGGVAWWAHIGGFVFGLLLQRLFLQRRHPGYYRQYPDEYWPY